MNFNRNTGVRLVIIAGTILLVCAILPWRMPIFKILIALAVAWIALNTGENAKERRGVRHETDDLRNFRYVCSSATVNLTDSGALPDRVEIDAVFSHVAVRLPVDVNVTVHVNSAFSSTNLPDSQNVLLGESTCHCGTQDPSAPRLSVHVNTVMSSLDFRMG